MYNFLLSPSILSADFGHLQAQLAQIAQHGADWVHIDVMDGHFVPNITMGPFIVKHCKKLTNLALDVHLMIENPERHIEAFAEAGASWLTIHVENNPNLYRTLQSIRELGVHPAVALNPGTPVSSIHSILDIVDMVLVMTVNPGFSGQAHIPSMVSKVSEIRNHARTHNPSLRIEVDGGINAATLPPMLSAGTDTVVAATAIFGHPQGIAAGIQELRDCSNE